MIANAASPFDIAARTYDVDFTHSGIGQLQRERVWKFLTSLLEKTKRPLQVLEINCGTGEDALRLAGDGHTVIATDASAPMIAIAKEKLNAAYTTAAVVFEVCAFDELASRFDKQKFDLVYSNFGGLNCIDKKALSKLSNQLSDLLQPDGQLVFVIMGSKCLWEIFYNTVRGKFRTATRRWRSNAAFTINGLTIPVYYYSPRKIKKIFSPLFARQEQHPVGLFIPPSYLENKFAASPSRLQRLNRLEKKWDHASLADLADHYFISFKKISP
ncbi:MAG: methyltransferase domain-containing protein [Ferruginibacter sp.]